MSSENNDMKQSNKRIKDRMAEIQKRRASLNVAEEENLCRCNHKSHNGTDLTRNGQTGEYICRKCHKPIDFKKKPSDQQLQEALDLVDTVCDYIKISLDSNNEKDNEMLKKIAKYQFRTRNMIMQVWKAVGKKASKRSNRNNNDEQSSWRTPVSR